VSAPQPGAGAPPLADALRVAAAAWQRFRAGAALDRALAAAAPAADATHPRVAAAARDIVYHAARQLALLDALIARLARTPPAPPVAALLAMGLAQLLAQRHASYAVVDQAVTAAKAAADTRAAAGFVNATLRNFLRRQSALIEQVQRDETVRYNAPRWWIERLRRAYPDAWQSIVEAQREPPPLVLRINVRRIGVDEYLRRLASAGLAAVRVGATAVWLREPRPVEAIPGFGEGLVSVQDAGSQLAAQWLDVRKGQRVLDACAAPGGKTAQLAELADGLAIDAVEIDAQRARRIEDNLARLRAREHATITLHVADAADTRAYAAGPQYDRILLDAPCTASGIVRRHPDIPWLRRDSDVAQLATRQARLLDALWPLVKPAGRLLYVVCSVFPEEGARQAERFVERHTDARPAVLPGQTANTLQLLPTPLAAVPDAYPAAAPCPTLHDGFFFALFEKAEKP
jgi:16S rRNA (cytosine967-C5)-methyltransferase